jgi:hypothetical protein
VIFLFTFIAVFFVPLPIAHAGIQDAFINIGLATVLNGVLALTQFIIFIESWLITQLLSAIVTILSWQSISSNDVIYGTWVIARNLVSLFFIVGLVVISFATIFRTLGFLQGYHWKTALPKLLIAAILINLSLALSTVVVRTSNRVISVFSGVLGNTVANLTVVMDANKLMTNPLGLADTTPASRNISGIENPGVAPDGTSFEQWVQHKENRTVDQEKAFQECLTETAPRSWLPDWGWLPGSVRKDMGRCGRELAMKMRGEIEVSLIDYYVAEREAVNKETVDFFASVIDGSENGAKAALITTTLFNILILAMLVISLGSVVIFFALRVIAVWVLMAFSAFAFGSMWMPGNWFKKWWDTFLGWNVFGAMYLLVLIFGMTFLMRKGDLTAGLVQAGGQASIPSALLGDFFFYMFALIIFVGGLWLALTSSFAAAVKSTPIAGAVASRLGVFSAIQASRALGRRTVQATGVPSTFQAAKERLGQEYKQRRPEALRMATEEERLAGARRRMGVREGAQEEYKLFAGRINKEKSSLEAGLKGLEAKDRASYLAKMANSRNKATALAARGLQLKRGELDEKGIAATRRMYPGGIAQAEFNKQVKSSAAARAREKKKEGEEQAEEIAASYADSKDIKGALGDLDKATSDATDPKGKAAYKSKMAALDKIAESSPEDAFNYALAEETKAAGGALPAGRATELLAQFYGKALDDPKMFAKLDGSYFEDGAKFDRLKMAVDSRHEFSDPKDRNRERGALLKASARDPKKLEKINQLFKP